MHATFKSLPEDPIELRAVSELMAAQIKAQAYQIEKLKKELAAHRKVRFGSKSETMDQLAFDLQEDTEIAVASKAQNVAPEMEVDHEAPAKRTHNRAPLPAHLERQQEVLSPGDSCNACGGALRLLGEDVTEELEYVPGHFVVKRIVRPRMTCSCCEGIAKLFFLARGGAYDVVLRPPFRLHSHAIARKHPFWRVDMIWRKDDSGAGGRSC